MSSINNDLKNYPALFMIICTIIYLAYFPSQSEFSKIFGVFTIGFAAYFYLLSQKASVSIKAIFIFGLLARILIIPAFPNLSDDIYRFIWDGHLWQQGLHPLSSLPSEIYNDDDKLKILFPLLNSPNYYTIYPPVAQVIFYLAAYGETLIQSSVIVKCIFLLFEVGSFYFITKLLSSLNKEKHLVIIYWLNPLIIVELMGNIHFEAIMVFFFAAAMYMLLEKKYLWSGIAFGLSIASKLVPLIFGPILLLYLIRKKKWIQFSLGAGIITLILFFPLFHGIDIGHFLASIDLYFRKFEFNASIYYLLRGLGNQIYGYNQIALIGPLLSVFVFISTLVLTKKSWNSDFEGILKYMFFIFLIYLLCATTVHPWYLAILLLLSLFINDKVTVIWSWLIVLSYYGYSQTPYSENLILNFIEYAIVIPLFIWYYISNHNPKTSF